MSKFNIHNYENSDWVKSVAFMLNIFLIITYMALLVPLISGLQYFNPNLALWLLGPAGSITNHYLIYLEVMLSPLIFAAILGINLFKVKTLYQIKRGWLLPLSYSAMLYGINGLMGYALLPQEFSLNGIMVSIGIIGIGVFISKDIKVPLATISASIVPYVYWGYLGSPYTFANGVATGFYNNTAANASEILQWTFMLVSLAVFLAIRLWKLKGGVLESGWRNTLLVMIGALVFGILWELLH